MNNWGSMTQIDVNFVKAIKNNEADNNTSVSQKEESNSIYDDIKKDENNSSPSTIDEIIEDDDADKIDNSIIKRFIECIKRLLGIESKNLDKDKEEPVVEEEQEPEPNTRDGKIEDANQSQNGDCWLISGINSLSYSDKGAELIKNALEYKDGSTTVHLKGIGNLIVTDDEVEQAKQDVKYAKGDDDMVIFELAIEKVMNEVQNNNLAFDYGFFTSSNKSFQKDSSIYGGFVENALYLVTGKRSEKASSEEAKEELFDKVQNSDSKEYALGAAIKDREKTFISAKTVDGEEVSLSSYHAYAIKEIKDDVATVINPWNSNRELNFSKETFIETFDDLIACDLSDENKSECHAVYPKTNENGDKEFKFETPNTQFNVKDGVVVNFDSVVKTYSKDNVPLQEQYILPNGEVGLIREFELQDGQYIPKIIYENY